MMDKQEQLNSSLHELIEQHNAKHGVVVVEELILDAVLDALAATVSTEPRIEFAPKPSEEAILAGALQALLYQFGFVKLDLNEVDNIDQALEEYARSAVEEAFHEDTKEGLLDIEDAKGWVLIAQAASKKINGLRRYFLEGAGDEG